MSSPLSVPPASLAGEIARRGRPELLKRDPFDVAVELKGQGAKTLEALALSSMEDHRTLGDLLRHRATVRRLEDVSFVRQAGHLTEALLEWADREGQTAAPSVPPAAPASGRQQAGVKPEAPEEPPPPGPELVAWAAEQDLKDALEAPARALLPWLQKSAFGVAPEILRLLVDWDVRRCVHEIPRGWPRPYQPAQLADAARAFLAYSASRRALVQARARSWAHPPANPRLALLAARLREQLDSVADDPGASAAWLHNQGALQLLPDPPRVLLVDRQYEHYGPVESIAALHLTGFEDRTPRLDCRCNLSVCAHRRVLLEWLLDLLYDPSDSRHPALAELVRVPSWERFVTAAERLLARPDTKEAPARIVWRVQVIGNTLLVTAAVQRRSLRGWTRGAKIDGALQGPERRLADTGDLQIARALGHASLAFGGSNKAELVRALVGHPRLFSNSEPDLPIEVERGHASLRIFEEGEALRMAMEVDGQRVGWPELRLAHMGDGCFLLLRARRWVVVELEAEVRQLAELAGEYDPSLPQASHPRLLGLLEHLQARVPVLLPEAVHGKEVPPDSQVILRVSPEDAGGLSCQLRVRPLHAGVTWPPGQGPERVFGVVGEQRVHARRDLPLEAARAQELARDLGLEVLPEGAAWRIAEDMKALELLAAARSLGVPVEWPKDALAWRVGVAKIKQLKVHVRRTGDWFGIEGAVEVDGQKVGLGELLSALREKRRYVRLGPGQFAEIEGSLAARVSETSDAIFADHGRLAIGGAALEGLEGWVEAGADLSADGDWMALKKRMEAARSFQPKLPRGLKASLRPYQRDGYRWLARLSAWGAGACLADDMGLGKTVQALAVLLARAEEGPALVVAPTSVGSNWLDEAKRFAPGLRTHLYRGQERATLLRRLGPSDLVVTSYEILALDVDALEGVAWGTFILDEAQAIKSARTRRAKAVRRIPAGWRLALTGTPVENHLGELWSLFSVVSPGLLGTWEHFRERFAAPIERDHQAQRLTELSRLLRPFVLRRTKRAVAPELPPRTEVTEPVELSSAERALYEVARQEAIASLLQRAGDPQARFEVLAAITRLRRLACHPKLLDETTSCTSAKLEAALELIDQLVKEGQRALVFSQFTSYLALLQEALAVRRYRYLYLDGSTPAGERAKLVRRWQAGDTPLFLLSLKAGGTGLNLTGADYVLHLDPWWNPAVEDQATDRTHRIGQERPVTVVRLIAQGTIEEAVLSLHAQKRELARGILDGTDVAGRLSTQELVDLIRFGSEVSATSDDTTVDAPEPSQEPAEKATPSEGRKKPKRGKKPEVPMDLVAIEALARAFDAQLEAELSANELAPSTVAYYRKVFERFMAYAREVEGPARPFADWRAAYLARLSVSARDGALSSQEWTVDHRVLRRAARLRPR